MKERNDQGHIQTAHHHHQQSVGLRVRVSPPPPESFAHVTQPQAHPHRRLVSKKEGWKETQSKGEQRLGLRRLSAVCPVLRGLTNTSKDFLR